MPKITFHAVIVAVVVIAGLGYWFYQNSSEKPNENTNQTLTREEAFVIANASRECLDAGAPTGTAVYDENTKTWRIDLKWMPELEQDGCNPVCVVDETTKTASIEHVCANPTPKTGHPDSSPNETLCIKAERDADACIEVYNPVCATVEIKCVRAPCEPITETYSNSCEACRNPLVQSYIPGECKE